jgi:hypothetical protein
MTELNEIFGTYKTSEKDKNSKFSNNFILKLYEKQDAIHFDFIMITSGDFGKIGKDWYGKGIFRNDHFALIIEQERDWTYTKSDDKTTEYKIEKHESLPIEIYTEESKVIIYHKYLNKYISLYKETEEQ